MNTKQKDYFIYAINEALNLLTDPDASSFDADRVEGILRKSLENINDAKIYSVWVLDRANQLTEYKYSSQIAADDASDLFEADGHDVFTDGHRAALARDRFARFLIKQHRLSVIHIS